MKTYRILAATVAAGLTLGLSACGDSKNPVGSDDKLASEGMTEGDGSGPSSLDDNGGADGLLTDPAGGLPATDQPVATANIVTVADLIERLAVIGTTAEETGDVVDQPFFTPVGQVLKVAGQDVQVFVYETVEALKEEARQVGADGYSIGTTMVSWVAPPHFYATGRVIVLYVGDDAAVMRALDTALGGPFAGGGADVVAIDPLIDPLPLIGGDDLIDPLPLIGGDDLIDPLPRVRGDDIVFELQSPTIMVATSEADIKQLILFTQDPELNERLMAVDLEDNLVVAVFRGEMRSAGYGIEVEDVQISGGTVEITVSLTDPGPDMLVAAVITHPVAVYVVPRADVPDLKAMVWVAVTEDGEVLAKFRSGTDSTDSSGGQVDGSDGLPVDLDGAIEPLPVEPLPVDIDEEPAPSLDDADIRGEISSFEAVESANGVVAQILVEGQIEDDTSFDKALVSITTRTVIVQPGVSTFAAITFRDLTPGRRVQVLFTGPVMESYPVQATALRVVILE